MEIFKLLGTVAIDGVDSATKGMEKLGSVAVKAGKAVAAGLAVGATAVSALAKQSLDSYADYEQLVGGVETLFKDSAMTIQGYADRAYETAGLSANEYMETVTSFSASLLQGLGGDTAKAAEIADRAITDMSDNANKMGTDMSMIQNAYQGFAKQNYTMLDNLKLGYGGTQAEMARLINESGVLGDSIQVTAGTVNSVSFDKIIEAIGVVQDRMGITGTTAKEASTTISGSIISMKAQWQNLITALAGDDWDIGVYISNFVESAKIAIKNMVPRIAQILSGISEAMTQIMPIISAELPTILGELLPGVINGAVALINGLIAALPTIIQILVEQLPSILTQIGTGLIQAFPILLKTVKQLFQQIWDYFSTGLLDTGYSFQKFCDDAKKLFEDAWSVLQHVWETVGRPVFDMILSLADTLRNTFAEYMPEIQEFVQQCFTDIQTFWNNNLKPCLEAIGNFIENVLAPVFEAVFSGYIGPAVETAFNFIKSLWNDVLKPVFTGITDFLTGVFTLNWEQAFEGLASIVKGVANSIINGIEFMVNRAIDGLNGLIAGLNKAISLAGSLLGLSIQIPTIPKLNLPRLEEGGILEKGQMGFLEGNGAEAVVPLDQNRAWISAVAKDMNAEFGGKGNQEIKELKEQFSDFVDALPEMLVDAFASMKFDVNNREFARLVKAVN